jgi:aminopeptidase N
MKKLFIIFILLSISNIIFGQDFSKMTGAQICSYQKSHSPNIGILFGDSPNSPKHSYDVLKYTLNLDIYNCFKNPGNKAYSGSNLINFRVDSTLNAIQLNAVYTSLVIDSVRLLSGTVLNYSHSSATNILTITLDRTYNPNEVVTIKIYYRHNNVNDNYFMSTTSGYVYTVTEPEGARNWFPCWDKPSDKALTDIMVKIPSNALMGSNGRLADSTKIADTIWYHWVSRDPMSTYLVVITGKTGYNVDISWWHKISNPNDSIPIRLYYATGENIAPTKNAIGDMTTYYSQTFGEHPFEKDGFASVSGFGGGMEHQTLTTISPSWSSVMSLISHEYGHQWFGDMITCGTWADIWLNEGFATYCEALYYEHTSGYASYKSSVTSDASEYLLYNPGWAMYNPSWINVTPPNSTLFNTAITYDKGACVLHMLRYTIGDSLFFAALKGYATDTTNFKYKCAVTDDFTTKISVIAGQDLTWFIDEWVKQPNHPTYQNTYGIVNLGGGNWRVNFTAKQTQTNSVFHKMPIVIKVSFTSGLDSSIRVMNDVNNQLFTFNFNRQPTAVVFDPNNDILLKTATLSIGIKNISNNVPEKYEMYQNYPNPFNPTTNIKFQIANSSYVKLKVYDILGKEIAILVNEKLTRGIYETQFYINSLIQPASGIYFYKIEAGDFTQVKRMMLIK